MDDQQQRRYGTSLKAQNFFMSLTLATACITQSACGQELVGNSDAQAAEPVRAISSEESFAPEFSLEQGRAYLQHASSHWWKTKSCVSCHTNGLHLFAESQLAPNSAELNLAQRRVRRFLREQIPKSKEVDLNARLTTSLIAATAFLAMSESREGAELDPETRRAFEYVWSIQSEEGHWLGWLKCDWPPYEVDDHFPVTLMAVAVGMAPKSYSQTPSAKLGAERIERYLLDHPPENMHQRLMLLWASQFNDRLVSKDTQQQWKQEIVECQNEDGGWTTAKLGDWKRSDGKPQDFISSDGYATGFVIFILRQTGTPADDPNLQRGITWLRRNQRASGRWYTRSPRIDKRHYISNAGTAFALLAVNSCSGSIGTPPRQLTKQSLPTRAVKDDR